MILKLRQWKNKTIIKSPYIGKQFSCGKYCIINKGTYIADNVEIGNFTYTNSSVSNVIIENNVKIGHFCSIAPGVMIALGNHYTQFVTTHPILYDPYYIKKMGKYFDLKVNGLMDKDLETVIGNDVWIGARAIIKRGVKISDGAIIASGSIVTKDVPAYAIVAGVPAKVIKYRFSEKQINHLQKIDLIWNLPDDDIVKNLYKYYNISNFDGEL
ncbi:MAG: CatB-related O-acetyltransferase [[Actinobacillus] rossii]|nr:CatB-related O-acetyltransferase [[Actinobacillus] rossii]MDY5792910.1 CatB-related O-acetyltransferase [[Actinobacillus] rossii]